MNYHDEIKSFIKANFEIDDDVEFSDDDNYFAMRFVNSLFAMRLVNFIEKKIGVEISSDDLSLGNFSTVNNVMRLINKTLADGEQHE